MSVKSNVVAIIPARAGSKRLPDKNKRLFCDEPLFVWSIDQALQCVFIDIVLLSTNDREIIQYCNDFYKEIDVNERPEHLATDEAKSEDVIIYELRNYPNDTIVILLQPTSPLRTRKDITVCYNRFMKNKHKQCIISLFQEDDLHYKKNGAVYIDYLGNIRKNKSFIPKQFYIMPKERSIDIDTYSDFYLAQKYMEKRLKNE